jgi:hypothetical protein
MASLVYTRTRDLSLPPREAGRVRLLNWYLRVEIEEEEPVQGPVDVTGWSIRAEVRDRSRALVLAWEAPALEMDAFGVSLHYSEADTTKIEAAGPCTWDLRLSRPYVNDARVLAGQCRIAPWTTKDP